jgi:hypothetical protein
VANSGKGVAAAIGEAVTGGRTLAISAAAQGANPPATADAANAAGIAAETVFNTMNMVPGDAGFAAAAAMGAVDNGATVIQATAIAAAIAATVKIVNYPTADVTAALTTSAVLAADANAHALAALAGAVAGATYYQGVPQEVEAAVTAALTAAGYINNAATFGNNAGTAATIPNNVLFNVHFATLAYPAGNVPHIW